MTDEQRPKTCQSCRLAVGQKRDKNFAENHREVKGVKECPKCKRKLCEECFGSHEECKSCYIDGE